MNRILAFILTSLVLFSCNKNDDSEDDNPYSVAVGDKIYTIEEGFDQEGAKGQYLENSIKISVTDFEGNAQYADFTYELSDEGGHISPVYDSEIGEEEWKVFSWKLGCTDDEQTLTIKDNVCNISRDGCVDITLFEITIVAGEPESGWVEACYEFDNYGVEKIFAHEDELFVYTYSELFITDDVSTNTWEKVSTNNQLDQYNKVWHYESGEMIFSNGSSLNLSLDNGRSWSYITAPSYGDAQISILANGKFLFISEYSDSVYESLDNGSTWSVLISDLSSITGNYYTNPLAITSSGNTAYVITKDNYIVEINGSTTSLHTFDSDAWNSSSYLEESYAMVEDNNIVLVTNDYNNYESSILNLNSNSQLSLNNLSSPGKLIRDSDELYLIPEYGQDFFYRHVNGNFIRSTLNLPDEATLYYSGQLTVFNGSPIYFSSATQKIYYYKD